MSNTKSLKTVLMALVFSVMMALVAMTGVQAEETATPAPAVTATQVTEPASVIPSVYAVNGQTGTIVFNVQGLKEAKKATVKITAAKDSGVTVGETTTDAQGRYQATFTVADATKLPFANVVNDKVKPADTSAYFGVEYTAEDAVDATKIENVTSEVTIQPTITNLLWGPKNNADPLTAPLKEGAEAQALDVALKTNTLKIDTNVERAKDSKDGGYQYGALPKVFGDAQKNIEVTADPAGVVTLTKGNDGLYQIAPAAAGTAQLTASYTGNGYSVVSNTPANNQINRGFVTVEVEPTLTGITLDPATATVSNQIDDQQTVTEVKAVPEKAGLGSFTYKKATVYPTNGSLPKPADLPKFGFKFEDEDNKVTFTKGEGATAGTYEIAVEGIIKDANGKDQKVSATATVTVTDKTIESLSILKDGTPVGAFLTVDKATTPSMTFTAATSGAPTDATTWTIAPEDSAAAKIVPPTTGSSVTVDFKNKTEAGAPVTLTAKLGSETAAVQIYINDSTTSEAPQLTVIRPNVALSIQGTASYDVASNVVVPAGITDVKYTSSNTTDFKLDGKTLTWNPTGIQAGAATVITATGKDKDGNEVSATYTVTVTAPTAVTGFTVESAKTMQPSTTATLAPQITPIDYTGTATWNPAKSSDTSVVKVETDPSTGVVTLTAQAKEGTAQIQTQLVAGGKTYTQYTTVTVTKSVPATAIEVSPEQVYLATAEGAKNSEELKVTLTPKNTTDKATFASSDEAVATVDEKGVVTAVAEGTATITVKAGEQTVEVPVVVSNEEILTDGIVVTSDDPDYFTVTAKNVRPNPALAAEGAKVEKVSMFAFSVAPSPESDLNAKVAEQNGNDFSYKFPVNDTPRNNYFLEADNITINVNATTDAANDGPQIGTASYKSVNEGNAGDAKVAYIAYAGDIGFQKPTKFDGAVAGTTGESRKLEGIRVSSNIPGVQVVADVHAQNTGWINGVEDGAYAGTMWQNLRLEAFRLQLQGPNADKYSIRYKAHVQNVGWQDWVSDGAVAGTTGQALRLEAVQIEIVEK